MQDVINFKVVVTGPFAAGKSAFISAVSEIPVVSTETGTTEGSDVKEHTTVTMDFGKISVADGERLMELYLFGTPGQSRFDFMWDILAKGMIGYVLLVDAQRPETWDDARDIGSRFGELSRVPMVVAANRLGAGDPAPLISALALGPEVPVIACEAIDRESVKDVLITLLVDVLEEIETTAKGLV
jgi:uncharacterized protein